jgi:hypothetical protein
MHEYSESVRLLGILPGRRYSDDGSVHERKAPSIEPRMTPRLSATTFVENGTDIERGTRSRRFVLILGDAELNLVWAHSSRRVRLSTVPHSNPSQSIDRGNLVFTGSRTAPEHDHREWPAASDPKARAVIRTAR